MESRSVMGKIMFKKVSIAALLLLPSLAFAMERTIECSIHPEEEPVNGINEIRISVRNPAKPNTVEITRWAMSSSMRKETFAVSDGPEFYWGEEEQISSSSTGEVRDSVSLVRSTDARGHASWAIVKSRSTLTGGAGCIPNEDKDCRMHVAEHERTPIVCTDSYDQIRSDPDATRRLIEEDPCYRGD